MSLIEELFESLEKIEIEEDEVKIEGFTMSPRHLGYFINHHNRQVATVQFVNKKKKEYDMETAALDPTSYTVFITEVQLPDKLKLYVKKLETMGFTDIETKKEN